MKSKYVLALIVYLFISISYAALPPISVRACPGGDGPGPFYDITNQFPQSFVQVKMKAEESTEEYLYWEKSDVLAYRNSKYEVRKTKTNGEKNTFIEGLNSSISRIVDPGERFIVADGKKAYVDATEMSPGWKTYGGIPVDKHLFWVKDSISQKDVLFSWANGQMNHDSDNREPVQSLAISRYIAGEQSSITCKLQATMAGEIYHLGQGGHHYPDIFVYKTSPSDASGNSKVSFYSLKITPKSPSGDITQDFSCSLSLLKKNISVPGKVRSAYRYLDPSFQNRYDAFIIKTDHPTDNVKWIWQSLLNKQCLLYNFNGREPYVLVNSKTPVITSWDEEEGINLVFPDKVRQAYIFQGLHAGGLREDDFWITSEANRLFVAATADMCSQRKIYFAELPKLSHSLLEINPLSALLQWLNFNLG